MSPDELYQSLVKEIDQHSDYDFKNEHKEMLYRRCHTPDVSETLERIFTKYGRKITVNRSLDVVELGCSFGFLYLSEMLYGKYKYRSWIGYDIDKIGIQIAKKLSKRFKFNNCKFVHSAVSGLPDKTLSYVSKRPLSMNLEHKGHHKVKNTRFEELPKCDLLLVDIEGSEDKLDLDKVDFQICILEANDKKNTQKILQQRIKPFKKKYKLVSSHAVNDQKSMFVFIKPQVSSNL
tara:strand:+ start:1137 stop:1838 length:702 start_codon:yes stop_codon:yes gene_type:complete